MALIPCPECQRDMSDEAAVCPSCGFRRKSYAGTNVFLIGAAGLLLGWIAHPMLSALGFVLMIAGSVMMLTNSKR